jgi:hypothetical protein
MNVLTFLLLVHWWELVSQLLPPLCYCIYHC